MEGHSSEKLLGKGLIQKKIRIRSNYLSKKVEMKELEKEGNHM